MHVVVIRLDILTCYVHMLTKRFSFYTMSSLCDLSATFSQLYMTRMYQWSFWLSY